MDKYGRPKIPLPPPPVEVREVWQSNLAEEFSLIKRCAKDFPFASMDTEFPGTVFALDAPKHSLSSLPPAAHYAAMKRNVDALSIIQFGLTLSSAAGRGHVWQFNFRGFDPDSDPHHPDSVALLRRQGIDFAENKRSGVSPRAFARLFLGSGLGPGSEARAWVTFHGLYDFGFLIKILTGKPLPEDLGDFLGLVRCCFGVHVYDLKPIARGFGLHGGLDKVAGSLGLGRAAGKSHQAGSDSLLTMEAFMKVVKNCSCTDYVLLGFNYVLYGLTCKF